MSRICTAVMILGLQWTICLAGGTGAESQPIAEDPSVKDLTFTVDTYPRVDGSTSANPLGVLVACRLTGNPCRWMWKNFMRDERHLYPVLTDGAPAITSRPAGRGEMFQPDKVHKALYEKTKHNKTHGSHVNLIAGKADLILAARKPSDDELKSAKEKGVVLESRPVALDAFVFIRNQANPVANLTVQQIQDIYTGKITNWKQVGGPNKKITPYVRNRNSGSQVKMERIVMKGLTMIKGHDIRMAASMIGPFNALRHDRQGIGYTVYYYNRYMQAMPAVKLIAVAGVMPSTETIRSRKYIYTTEVYMTNRKGLDPKSAAGRLRAWLLSPWGQKIVAESGYVPIR